LEQEQLVKKIYVAGGSSEAKDVAAFIRNLEGYGFECTFNWTNDVLNAKMPERDLPNEKRLELAKADSKACIDAEIVWFIIPEKPTRGMWTELGIVSVRHENKEIVVSGMWRESIFTAFADQFFDHHYLAFNYIIGKYGTKQ
jgi:hypothetical protein